MSTLIQRGYTVNGLSLESIGLDDVWVLSPDRKAARVSGFIQRSGLGIVESLLLECPEDHTMIFDPNSSLHINPLVLH